MTKRERFLALGVGGLVLVVVLQWGLNKYRDAVRFRSNRISALQNEKEQINEKLIQGALADRQMGEYLVRSLPSDIEQARGDYQTWLLNTVQEHGLADAKVDPTNAIPVGDLYQRLSFRVAGRAELPELIEFLYGFYAKDYLHRIREFSVAPSKAGGLDLKMSIDVAALNDASPDARPPNEDSWRVEPVVAAYKESILNRNFFEPPNQVPTYEGEPEVEAIVGQASQSKLAFTDPDGDDLRYEWVEDPPEFIELDKETGTLHINSEQKGEFKLAVRAVDQGYPRRSAEQQLVVKVGDAAAIDEPAPEFDDARQTVLTALVQGGGDWTAWMNVRTKGKTLKLQVGDEFEIGTVKGTVVEVTPRFVLLEIGGQQFTLRPAGILAEAAKGALKQED